jgi:hypothetical protein
MKKLTKAAFLASVQKDLEATREKQKPRQPIRVQSYIASTIELAFRSPPQHGKLDMSAVALK